MSDIGSSVGIKGGVPCYNNPDDQKIVMDLLEQIDVSDGGVSGDPAWSRPAAGALRWKFCPESLRAAILKFQTSNRAKLPFLPDGHVDPGGATIRLMNSLAAAGGTVKTLPTVDVTGGLQDIEMEIHDLRIPGGGRFAPNRHVRFVDSRTPYSAVLGLVDAEIGKGRQIARLDIIAHGFYVGEDNDAPLFGVMVGREGIHPGFTSFKDLKDGHGVVVYTPGVYAENLSPWKRFNGRIDEIRLYSCGAANPVHKTGTGIADMQMSGYEMCGQLAVFSGAYVMAAKQTQGLQYRWDTGDWPFRSRSEDPGYEASPADPSLRRPDRANTRVVPTNFGAWEGPVYVFSPITGSVIATSTNGADPSYSPGT